MAEQTDFTPAATGRAEQFRTRSAWERIAALRRRSNRPAPAIVRRVYEAILERWPGDHLVSRFPGGESARVAARYRHLSWNPEEYQAFRAATRAGNVVLDVGANIGAYTLLFGQWVGPSGRVFAFEPGAAARAGLLRHVVLNGLAGRVEVSALAASGSVGVSAFDEHGASGVNALCATPTEFTSMVATTTLDQFCSERGIAPAVIKIDVEGAEFDVLEGARQTIANPALRLFVEFHPSIWAARGISVESVRQRLAAWGLDVVPLAPHLDPWSTEGVSVELRRA